MADDKLYGTHDIAEHWGISEEGVRLRRKNGADFIKVSSISNKGGGCGLTVWSYASSLDYFDDVMMPAHRSMVGSQNSLKRRRGSKNDPPKMLLVMKTGKDKK